MVVFLYLNTVVHFNKIKNKVFKTKTILVNMENSGKKILNVYRSISGLSGAIDLILVNT